MKHCELILQPENALFASDHDQEVSKSIDNKSKCFAL